MPGLRHILVRHPGEMDESEDSLLRRRHADPLFQQTFEDTQARNELIQFLVRLRWKHQWSQTDLAKRLKTTQSAVSDLENGRSQPRLSTIQRWARVFGHRLELQLWTGPFVAFNSWVARSLPYETVVQAVRTDDEMARSWFSAMPDITLPSAEQGRVKVHLSGSLELRPGEVKAGDVPYFKSLAHELDPEHR